MADIQQMAPVMSDADREVARTLRREKVSRVVRYVVLIFVGLLMLYPLAWMFSASFKPNHEIFTTLGLWPGPRHLGRVYQRLEDRHRIPFRPLYAEHL